MVKINCTTLGTFFLYIHNSAFLILFKYIFLSVATVIHIKKGKEQEQLLLSGEQVQCMLLNSPILLAEQFLPG